MHDHKITIKIVCAEVNALRTLIHTHMTLDELCTPERLLDVSEEFARLGNRLRAANEVENIEAQERAALEDQTE